MTKDTTQPCLRCEERHELCHQHCEHYAEYRKLCDEIARQKRVDADIRGHIAEDHKNRKKGYERWQFRR